MPLQPCRECGHEVSTEAKTCPSCGVADPTGSLAAAAGQQAKAKKAAEKRNTAGCLGCLGLVFILVVIGSISDGGTGKSSGIVDLHAAVRFDGSQFQITNLDAFAWTDCKFEVNGDYEYHVPQLAAGEGARIGALRFTKSDGERFNPFAKAAKTFFVWCHQSDGNSASWHGTWKD
jgi:hypothetical protein